MILRARDRIVITVLFGFGCMKVSEGAAQTQWRIARSLTVPALNHDLSTIQDVVINSRGLMAARETQDMRFTFFDSSGARLGRFGSGGQGPGEFSSLRGAAGWRGDSLWVYDSGNNRITFIDRNQHVIRSVSVPSTVVYERQGANADYLGLPTVKAITPGNDLVVMTSMLKPTDQKRASRNVLLRTAVTGQLQTLIAVVPETPAECVRVVRGGTIGLPNCGRPLVEVSSSGDIVVVVRQEPSRRGRISIVGISTASGDTIVNRSMVRPLVRVPKTTIDSLRASALKGRSVSPALRQAYQQITYPPYFDAFRRLIVGLDRSIWLEQADADGVRTWIVLDKAGSPMGKVTIPARMRVHAATLASLWAVEEDELGEQTITRYFVVR